MKPRARSANRYAFVSRKRWMSPWFKPSSRLMMPFEVRRAFELQRKRQAEEVARLHAMYEKAGGTLVQYVDGKRRETVVPAATMQ